MSLTINAVLDNALKEIEEARVKRAALLEKAADLGREIATLEAEYIIAQHHAAAQAGTDAVPPPSIASER